MLAIILAAGEGRRMRPKTLRTPKPLLACRDSTLLEQVLEAVRKAGAYDRIVIVVGYLGQQIVDKIGDLYRGIPVKYVWQDRACGTYDAVYRAREHIDGEAFLMVNADDLQDHLALREAAKHRCAIIAARAQDPTHFGVIERAEDGRLTSITEKPPVAEPYAFVSTGAIVTDNRIFSPDFSPVPAEGQEMMITDAIRRMINHGIDFQVVQADGWLPISCLKELDRVNHSFQEI